MSVIHNYIQLMMTGDINAPCLTSKSRPVNIIPWQKKL